MIWLILNLVLFFIFDYAILLIHEFGHAAVARIVRFRILSVRIGYGRRLIKANVFGIPTIVNLIPLLGLTYAVPIDKKWIRLKLWFFAAGGLAVQSVILITTFIFSPDSFYLGYVLPKITSQLAPIEIFVLANFLILIFNIIPRRIGNPITPLYTDGYQLVMLPFLGREKVARILRDLPRVEAWEIMRESEHLKALEIYDRELLKRPDDNLLRHDRAICLLNLGKFDESRNILTSLVGSDEFGREEFSLILKNNIAWLDAVLGVNGDLVRADEYSRIAYEAVPHLAVFCGTRGSVLIRLGKIEEGLEMLKRSFKVCSDPDNRAAEACFVALGSELQNKPAEADAWMNIAFKESPNYALNQIFQKEIETSRSGNSPKSNEDCQS